VEIDCPADCVYLSGGAPGWVRDSERLLDARRLQAMAQGLGDAQARLLFLGLAGLAALRGRHPGLDDARLAMAATAVRKTSETRLSGLVYEHAPDDARAQSVTRDLAGLFEAQVAAGRHAAPADRDLVAVLKALEAGLAVADPGAKTSFLDTVARLTGAPPTPAPASRILKPGRA
jgi:hypothetical protein